MIHYHGTPVSGNSQDAARFLAGRHALVPFTYKDNLAIVADVCQSFVFDNGAFSVWKSGKVLDVAGYINWVEDWYKHPAFDWALIPDVIDGDEQANDRLLEAWPKHLKNCGVPVWHLHESIERLQSLARNWRIVALGSSGDFSQPGTNVWWQRIRLALASICDEQGRPPCKLHGLRMLDPQIFTQLPLSSADSTNAAVNAGSLSRFGMYTPPTAGQRAQVIGDRIEQFNSSPVLIDPSNMELAL